MTHPTTDPMTDRAAAEALLAEALHGLEGWAVEQVGWMHGGPYDRSRMEVARALLAHPALADTLLRGLGAGRGEARYEDCMFEEGDMRCAWTREEHAGAFVATCEHEYRLDCHPYQPARPGPTDGPSQRGEGGS